MEKMTAVKALNTYFNDGDGKKTVTEFAKEIKALTPEDKAELAAGAAAILGVELLTPPTGVSALISFA